ncbi:MAG: helix-turn-helix domain-containing protein [Bacteroidota bacterium]
MSFSLKVIKDLKQYSEYCNLHESLMLEEDWVNLDTIELLELLIENFDAKRKKNPRIKPVELLRVLIEESWESQRKFASEIQLSPQLISDILNYRRKITKTTAQRLASFFAMKQEAFLHPYDLEEEKKLQHQKSLTSANTELKKINSLGSERLELQSESQIEREIAPEITENLTISNI